MLLYGTAVLAARRAARRHSDTVVVVPGLPLWRLLLEELAHGVRTRWHRLVALFRRPHPTGNGLSAHRIVAGDCQIPGVTGLA